MASIKDVAKLAGVGIGTASRVLNNHPNVSDATRTKVLEAIKKLDFVPSEAARNLKLKTSQEVALLIPSTMHPYLSKIAYHVEEELFKYGYKMMLCNNHAHVDKELSYLTMLRRNKIAGIIGITYNDIESFIQADIPMVSIDRNVGASIPCVAADNFEGGRIACRELIAKGCSQLAFLGDLTSTKSEVKQRQKGFVYEASLHGLDVFSFSDIEKEDIHDNFAYIESFLDATTDIDGVFCISDLLAASFIKLARRRGRLVPQDLKVIGFDGIQDTTFFHPVLSTIKQPVDEICRVAVELLIRKMDEPDFTADIIHIPVTYIEGETT
jgi:LacI family transcriptional regulator